MKIKSERDFWSGLIFIVVGLGFAWGATNYNFGSSARPGPGFFPFGLGVILAALGALVAFKALTIESDGGDPIGGFAWKPLGVILSSVILFGLLLPRLGMIVTLPMLIIVSSLTSGEFHWKEVLVNSVVLTAGSWGIFIYGLNLVIPLWPVFITG
ncbi:MAG: tripartite tricarboxylate transporter TctB family protein [Rubrivivax sp.]|nr:tripartite tricarboxylate transporter TctB family protein [Rubrivivax sp.]MDP3086492.1 tripartite tricarboxylate transporter TctB family protein [Rubrivivax sp.]